MALGGGLSSADYGVSDLDSWGGEISYRCPGVHRRWELVSFGPDGIDDLGEGDDIVVGEEEE